MKWIVFTSPRFLPGEAPFINRLFESGIDMLHFRKPGARAEECRRLLEAIDSRWLPRVVMHDRFELCREYSLGGVHLNSRNPIPPRQHQGTVSRSCHSLGELREWKPKCSYLTLSPIFNSVSKQGYMSAFTESQLLEARNSRLIDEKVVALGGITLQNINKAKACGFGGVAMLGDVWQRKDSPDAGAWLKAVRQACSPD